jgi:hypothetical protein
MADPLAPPILVQKKKGMGCFGCGCAIVIVVLVLLVLLGIFGGRAAYTMGLGYTSPAAETLPTGDAGDAVYAAAHQKVDAFADAFENQQPATLFLSADEINTLITRDPAYDQLRGHLHVALHDNVAVIESSNRIGDLETLVLGNPTTFADRYLNSVATGTLSIDPNTHLLIFNITSLKANDQDVPPSVAAFVNTQVNGLFYAAVQKNQVAKDFLARVQTADIQNGGLVIKIK